MSTPPKHNFMSTTPPKWGKMSTTPPKYSLNDPNSKFSQLFNAAPPQPPQSDPNTQKNHDNSPLSSSSSQQQHIETLQNQITSKIQQMKHFKEQMKRRRVEQEIQEKQEENPFVVKESYVDRELKKLNHLGNKGELKIVENGKQEQDQDEMEKKVQEILKKINL